MEISPRATEKSSKLHVLIVDDELLIRWSMAETLGSAGCEVTEASDGREALQRLSTGRPQTSSCSITACPIQPI